MKIKLASTLRPYDRSNLSADLIAGTVIAAVSIPISMGYSEIAGLPAVYGLYGSVFPIIVFALLSTSPQMIFGVDAAPAALVGTALLSLGIQGGSEEAARAVPVLTFFVAVWLLIFYLLKAGRLVNYISLPVMGGFISGICTTIILMQIPKLMGGSPGVGELLELSEHIVHSAGHISLPSLSLGLLTIAIISASKHLAPKFPMAVLVMALSALAARFLPTKELGIAMLSSVEPGTPSWSLPDFSSVPLSSTLSISLSVAGVIMAETLLAENNFAQRNAYSIEGNSEILAFALGNMSAALTGCCPMNGSVSRTAMAEQYQSKSQLTGLFAGAIMAILLIFCTGFIGYLPVPVLTAIVITALWGATEFHLARKLWRLNKDEFLIFCGAFLGVLVFGTINGVLIGVILSFAEMILRTSKPPRSFLGYDPEHRELRDLKEGGSARQIEGVVIYKFSASLFFGNCQILAQDIESAIEDDTKAVIIDGSAVTSIDITAAERIEGLYRNLSSRGIKLYLTEHIADLNIQLRKLGLGYMIEEGAVRKTVAIALKDLGYRKPYPLKGSSAVRLLSPLKRQISSRMQEFTWAFGDDAEHFIEKQIHLQIEQLKETGDMNKLFHGKWNYKEELDEDEWLEHLEEHLKEIVRVSGKNEVSLADTIESYRSKVYERIREEHPELADRFRERRAALDRHLEETRPDVYELILKRREIRRSRKDDRQ